MALILIHNCGAAWLSPSPPVTDYFLID